MAKPAKSKLPLPAKQSRDYLRGVFLTLQAFRNYGEGLQIEGVEAVAADLGVPKLFVEAAMGYEHADVVALGEWWQALQEGGAS